MDNLHICSKCIRINHVLIGITMLALFACNSSKIVILITIGADQV